MEYINWISFGSNIITSFVILFIALLIVRILRKGIKTLEERNIRKVKTEDKTKYNFIRNSIGTVVYSIAIILVINTFPSLKQLGTALFAGAGVLAAIVGFASQAAFANIISGIFVLIFEPFRVGDIVELQSGLKGVITDITLRHTIIKDYENRRIIIPNSTISDDTIINCTISDEKIRKHIEFGISYDADINHAISIIETEIKSHPLWIDGRTANEKKNNEPVIVTKVISLSDSSVDIRSYAWSKGQDNAFVLQCDVFKSVKEKFDNEGIEIPYPHRAIITKSA